MRTPFWKEVTFDKGRVVWGAPGKTKDKDKAGKPLTTKDGSPRIKCDFGVAIPKAGTTVFWQTKWGAELYQVALAAFPHLFDPVTKALLPGRKFSFKVTDGDSLIPNENGRVPAQQEGYPGCWVVAFGSSFIPRCVRWQTGAFVDIPPAEIKTGHEVQVAGSIDSNSDTAKPGVYVNHGLVAHAGILPEIISQGIDPVAAGLGQGFSGSLPMPAGGLPAGALPNPGTPAAGFPAPGLPSAGPAPVFPSQAQALPAVTLPAPTGVAPQPGFLAPVPNAPAAPVPVPPVVVGPVMTVKANGVPWASFAAQGWTEADARAQGYIV